ncbi:glycoside hydrolase family 65 [Paenibacillus agricola]|uniref:Glycoside hydrolase family 65 n=1 Tax=Paenibacillus agricola TaxID=2716264 RepID=A0ABX0JBW8_9BACL|nr:glycoside hydrolase family 65 [Paenibacillus agricola]NHN33443.1 glycoside hydrolase family 65 [Paenibacillus agricola]
MNLIDRKALVTRHNPIIKEILPVSPLSVGNGEFAFTADLTGLQSFPEAYQMPLGTQSQWGWHQTGGSRYELEDAPMQSFETNGRIVEYPFAPGDKAEVFHWLRQNPHRLQLGQIGLVFLSEEGKQLGIEHLEPLEQQLNLWEGVLTSKYTVSGVPVEVVTCCHPESDQVAFHIESPLLAAGLLQLSIQFPSSTQLVEEWRTSIQLEWEHDTHQTDWTGESANSGRFDRRLDEDSYQVACQWSEGVMEQQAAHNYRIIPSRNGSSFSIVIEFIPAPSAKPAEYLSAESAKPARSAADDFDAVLDASVRHWEQFWLSGGAVELAGSKDPLAHELERRIVLSQFVTAIHCAGSLPPQETGLLYNSWYGKFHLEMHWWHAVHFALWGRAHLLKKSLGWYNETLHVAQKLAEDQGYAGARWPKMVGPDARQSPSPIGNLLIWQQPHPIIYAELCYRADPSQQTLHEFAEVVEQTAKFMASYAHWDEQGQRYVLGPPLIPAQENFAAEETWNPTFELEYWRHALEIAQAWRARLGLEASPEWQRICELLAELPIHEGVYIAHENRPSTFQTDNTDHPSMLGALGILPGKKADHNIMKATLQKVMQEWDWPTSWGWDFPMAAMTAGRLGDGQLAVQILLRNEVKNTYLPNGHNYQDASLMAYLPGNGGLLTAVAMMACGWEDGPVSYAPGFPSDGSWQVRWEGLSKWM